MTWNKQYSYFKTKKQKGYDSKFEAGYGDMLDMQKFAKEIRGYETHVRMPLEVNGYKICDYYIDFVVHHNDGTIEYVETKGYPTATWKIKWKLFCALYEDDANCKVTLVMQGKSWKPRLNKIK